MPGEGSTRLRVLVIEEDRDSAAHLEALIRDWGYESRAIADAHAARAAVSEWLPHLAIVDLGIREDGSALLAHLRRAGLDSVVTSARPNIAAAAEAVSWGASVFLEKPVSPSTLRSVLADAERRAIALASGDAPAESGGAQTLLGMVSANARMHEVFELIRCVAPTDANVLITGENGTGKELVANALHALSPRRNRPFIKVNCAALPAELIESELFGHRRGAFTGAVMNHVGLFEAAAGGTVLLDEIGEMPPPLQTKLLRVLQERRAVPVGGLRPVELDFRLITATNSDLRRAASRGDFRQDLYFRINTIGIAVPPLRERPEDIPLLVDQFLERFGRQYGRRALTLDAAARDALLAHDWRGNVRELEHAIERAVIVSRGQRVHLSHLPEPLVAPRRARAGTAVPPIMPLAELERLAIVRTLEHTRGNKRAAAAILGVYRPTLYSKLRKYGISDVGHSDSPQDS